MATAPTAPPSITPLSDTPNRATDTPSEFSTKTDTFLNELNPFSVEHEALSGWTEATAQEVYDNAGEASTSASNALASEVAAAASAALADTTANYKGLWSSLTGALNQPATVFHNGGYWLLNTDLADVTASEPSTANSDWEFYVGTRWGVTITASQTLAKNSLNSVEATGGAVDLALPTLAEGDFIVVHNSSASTQQVRVTNSSYTIRSKSLTISSGDNIVLTAGYPLRLIARSATILEVS